MKIFQSPSFFSILKESISLLPKNGKLMVFIPLCSILLHFGIASLFIHLIEYLTSDMMANLMPDPQSFRTHDPASFTPKTGLNPPPLNPSLQRDAALVILVETTFILSISVVLFLSAISTIVVSAASYTAKPLSVKDFFSGIWRTWKRPLITAFYVSSLIVGFFFAFAMLVSPLLLYNTYPTLAIAAVFGIIGFVLYLYLCVPWGLAIVISVAEETSSGLHALGKARDLVKGKRLHGFLLNVAYGVVCLMISLGSKMALGNKWLNQHAMIFGLLFVIPIYLSKFFLIVTYTVLYFQCKKIHGEEVDLHGTVLYTKLPTQVGCTDY